MAMPSCLLMRIMGILRCLSNYPTCLIATRNNVLDIRIRVIVICQDSIGAALLSEESLFREGAYSTLDQPHKLLRRNVIRMSKGLAALDVIGTGRQHFDVGLFVVEDVSEGRDRVDQRPLAGLARAK